MFIPSLLLLLLMAGGSRLADAERKKVSEPISETRQNSEKSDELIGKVDYGSQLVSQGNQPSSGNQQDLIDKPLFRKKRDENRSSYTEFDSGLKLEKNVENKKVIRIGHLGAVGVMPNDAKILNISKEQLVKDGLIGEDVEFEIVSRATCSESLEGVAVAAELYHIHQVRAFIGPYCATELEAVTKMATFWNIPIISYSPTSNALLDRNVYKTLARISTKNINAIAEATVSLLQHYGWNKVRDHIFSISRVEDLGPQLWYGLFSMITCLNHFPRYFMAFMFT